MQFVGFQGDLNFFRAETIPEGSEPVRSGVLVAGSGSGHAHQIEDMATADVFRDPKTGLLFIRAKKPTRVVHGRAKGFQGVEADTDYHNPVTLEPGIYAAGIVDEVDWLTRTIRQVVD